MMEPDDNRDREHNRSDWRFIVVGILALALIGLVIVNHTQCESSASARSISARESPRCVSRTVLGHDDPEIFARHDQGLSATAVHAPEQCDDVGLVLSLLARVERPRRGSSGHRSS